MANKRKTKGMNNSLDVGANVTVDMDEDLEDITSFPATPSKEPASKKGRCSDTDIADSALAKTIINSLKSVINERSDILDKGIEGLKESVEFLTEELKDIKIKTDRTDKRVNAAEKRIDELENKVLDLARYKRRWNLRLYGLQEKEGENVRQRVLDVCKAVAPDFASKMNELTDSVHRLGKLKTTVPTPGNTDAPSSPKP